MRRHQIGPATLRKSGKLSRGLEGCQERNLEHGVRMQPRDETYTAAQPAARSGDETVESGLTAEEQLWLLHAGDGATEDAACADAPASHSQPRAGDNSLLTRTARVDAIGTATFAAVILCLVAAWLRHPAVPHGATPAAIPNVAQGPPRSAASEPQRPPVQVRNPFDRSEVFELPADATAEQAREAVAELLLERARSRLHQLPAVSTRIMQHRMAGTTQIPPESFVTEVSATFK